MKKLSFSAATKLQVDQIRWKTTAKFKKPLFVQKSNIFKGQNDLNLSSNETNNILELLLLRKPFSPINTKI